MKRQELFKIKKKYKSNVSSFLFIIILVLCLPHSAFATHALTFGTVIAASEVDMANTYQSVTASYEDVNGQISFDNPYLFSDLVFAKRTTQPNPYLAIASAYLAAASYQKLWIDDALEKLRFDIIDSYFPPATKQDLGMIAYTIGHKIIFVEGVPKDLYIVCIRGTAKNFEWVSNFEIGENKTEHAGFAAARDTVLAALNKVVTTTTESNIFWITGHSRGAAVANLLAATLYEQGRLATPDNIHAYTYATPNVSKLYDKYPNIYNYVNQADFVTRLPLHTKWGYGRHGIDIILPNDGKIEKAMKEYFKKTTNHGYGGFSKWHTDSIVRTVESYAPSVRAYYDTRWDLLGWHSPSSFFTGGVASILMGDIDMDVLGSNLADSALARYITYELFAFQATGKTKSFLTNNLHGNAFDLMPFAHAHSKESYIGYMHALYDDIALNIPFQSVPPTAIGTERPADSPTPSPTLIHLPDESEPILQVTTKEQWPDGTLSGRIDYVSKHRATKVGVQWGETRETLALYDFDDLETEANDPAIEFFYSSERIAGRGGYFQAFADVDGARYYGEIRETKPTFTTDAFVGHSAAAIVDANAATKSSSNPDDISIYRPLPKQYQYFSSEDSLDAKKWLDFYLTNGAKNLFRGSKNTIAETPYYTATIDFAIQDGISLLAATRIVPKDRVLLWAFMFQDPDNSDLHASFDEFVAYSQMHDMILVDVDNDNWLAGSEDILVAFDFTNSPISLDDGSLVFFERAQYYEFSDYAHIIWYNCYGDVSNFRTLAIKEHFETFFGQYNLPIVSGIQEQRYDINKEILGAGIFVDSVVLKATPIGCYQEIYFTTLDDRYTEDHILGTDVDSDSWYPYKERDYLHFDFDTDIYKRSVENLPVYSPLARWKIGANKYVIRYVYFPQNPSDELPLTYEIRLRVWEGNGYYDDTIIVDASDLPRKLSEMLH